MNIVGISALYHDSAAALVSDGSIVAAAQEERFTRKKHDAAFPHHALQYCLRAGDVSPGEVDLVVFYEKPLTTFTRLLRTHLRLGARGFGPFREAMPLWIRQKLWIPLQVERSLEHLGYGRPRDQWFAEHHQSHAASAFFPSPFSSAAVLTFDGVGEWATSSIAIGRDNHLTMLEQLHFPNSVGLLYSAFTYFCGFRVNSGEYKLMGLAPYGEPRYVDTILDRLVDVRDDGSLRLDMGYFDFLGGATMTNKRFADLFGGPPRAPESEITTREVDLAASIQVVTEEIVLRMARHARVLTGERNVCLAGGVALNCVANGRLLREGPFDRLWAQPAAGDAGGALGAALHAWYEVQGNPRVVDEQTDAMRGAYLGPEFSDAEIERYLTRHGYPYVKVPDRDVWAKEIGRLVACGDVVGLLIGRMEFGPRALGHRSIIGDPRSPAMQSIMNLKIKYRESFRPFAPAVLAERAAEVFDLDVDSPYMLLTAEVRDRIERPAAAHETDLRARVNEVRSSIPAVTHVDYSARVQTVSRDQSPAFHAIISAFAELTGCATVINTSFNVRGEPIVCTPEDAYRCFMRTDMDHLVLGSCLLDKREQPAWPEDADWQKDLILD